MHLVDYDYYEELHDVYSQCESMNSVWSEEEQPKQKVREYFNNQLKPDDSIASYISDFNGID